jgi:hypothetical protein
LTSGFDATRVVDGAADAQGGGADAAKSDAALADAGAGAPDASASVDASALDAGGAIADASISVDAGGGVADASFAVDAGGTSGVITGGPCSSGASGATALRVRWAGSGGTAYPVYEVHGLPDSSEDKVGAYGYSIGYTPAFVDTFLGDGGLALGSSNFVDIELSTLGISQLSTATISIYGRSFNTTTSGSFSWQTFEGIGSTATNFVSNVAPYNWYSADMTSEISGGDDSALIRIKAGPNSNSLVVNRIELCFDAS